MKAIALTGHPEAQHHASMQLTALIAHGGYALTVCIGVSTAAEAHTIHDAGGEVWHCGPYRPLPELSGRVDRVLTGSTAEEIAPHVAHCLAEMLRKKDVGAEVTS